MPGWGLILEGLIWEGLMFYLRRGLMVAKVVCILDNCHHFRCIFWPDGLGCIFTFEFAESRCMHAYSGCMCPGFRIGNLRSFTEAFFILSNGL